MTPRALHVLESLTPGRVETTFLHMLRSWRADASMRHDVLALAGGSLEPAFRDAAERLVVTNEEHEIAALVDDGFSVVHLLFERCAHRIAPMLLARTDARIVYAKGYDLSCVYRLAGDFRWTAEESLLAACDAVTFTTPELAAAFVSPPNRTLVLESAVDFERFDAITEQDVTPMARRVLQVLHGRPQLVDRGVM